MDRIKIAKELVRLANAISDRDFIFQTMHDIEAPWDGKYKIVNEYTGEDMSSLTWLWIYRTQDKSGSKREMEIWVKKNFSTYYHGGPGQSYSRTTSRLVRIIPSGYVIETHNTGGHDI